MRAPLVRSLTSTRMIDKLGELYGVPVYETAVGFKYLGPKMIETGAMAAGEESGGYAIAEHLPERDGCFTGLLMLDLLARSGKTMSQLVQDLYAKVGQHFYDRIDVHVAPEPASKPLSPASPPPGPDDAGRAPRLGPGHHRRLPLRARRRLDARPSLRHGTPTAHLHRDDGPDPGSSRCSKPDASSRASRRL